MLQAINNSLVHVDIFTNLLNGSCRGVKSSMELVAMSAGKDISGNQLTSLQKGKSASTLFNFCWKRLSFYQLIPSAVILIHFFLKKKGFSHASMVYTMSPIFFMANWYSMADVLNIASTVVTSQPESPGQLQTGSTWKSWSILGWVNMGVLVNFRLGHPESPGQFLDWNTLGALANFRMHLPGSQSQLKLGRPLSHLPRLMPSITDLSNILCCLIWPKYFSFLCIILFIRKFSLIPMYCRNLNVKTNVENNVSSKKNSHLQFQVYLHLL